jgi:hypothetical protein
MGKLSIVSSETGRLVIGDIEFTDDGSIKKDGSGFTKVTNAISYSEFPNNPSNPNPFDTKPAPKPLYNHIMPTEIFMKIADYCFIDDPDRFGYFHNDLYLHVLNKVKEARSEDFTLTNKEMIGQETGKA